MRTLRFALFALAATSAYGAPIVLDFEGVNSVYPRITYANVQEFYNGGTSSDGTSGTNFGVSFGANALAICLNTPGNSCSNTSRGSFGDANSQRAGLFFLSGTETFMNVAAGFDTGFSFYYVSVSFSGSVSVFDGVNGTGNLLATLNLTPNANSGVCNSTGAFCPFAPIGVTFNGTARSVAFGGVANQIVFDDITFGSATPGRDAVPEPGSVGLLSLGIGLLFAVRRLA